MRTKHIYLWVLRTLHEEERGSLLSSVLPLECKPVLVLCWADPASPGGQQKIPTRNTWHCLEARSLGSGAPSWGVAMCTFRLSAQGPLCALYC